MREMFVVGVTWGEGEDEDNILTGDGSPVAWFETAAEAERYADAKYAPCTKTVYRLVEDNGLPQMRWQTETFERSEQQEKEGVPSTFRYIVLGNNILAQYSKETVTKQEADADGMLVDKEYSEWMVRMNEGRYGLSAFFKTEDEAVAFCVAAVTANGDIDTKAELAEKMGAVDIGQST